MSKGKFICFEGMDFSGKTTTLNNLTKLLDARGVEYITTREPGGTALAEKLRALLLNDTTIDVFEQALLFQAARRQHCRLIIQPALDEGKWVISDRYIISSLVYQHDAKKLLQDTAKLMNLIEPDYLIYTRCGYETTLQRKQSRKDNNHLDEVFTRHYEKYSKLFDHYACLLEDMSLTIDTNKSTDEIELILGDFVDKILGDKNV